MLTPSFMAQTLWRFARRFNRVPGLAPRVRAAYVLRHDVNTWFCAMMPTLVDPFQRAISYLRVSVTDRCDFRCVYCMSENMTFLPKKELLSLEELDRMCSVFIGLGVKKLRITGGEPLVRRGIMGFFASMTRHLDSGALDELTLTTNGSQLTRFADDLFAAGVRRVNVSLDTLDADKFARVTKWGRLKQVLGGIDAAQAAGLRVKINTVALLGFNESELFALTEWCAARDFDHTWIEVMPMGDMGEVDRIGQYWSLEDVRARLRKRYSLADLSENSGGPARYVRLEETGQKIGFITPLSHNFCESCNRVRLTCTGTLYMCLGQEDSADLRAPLRAHPDSDAPLVAAIHNAIAHKPKGHDFDYSRQRTEGQMSRHMSHTGG
jgi:cyclic pyranopterin phosphate synthase